MFVIKQIHRRGWEWRLAIILLLYRIRGEPQRGSPCALASWWPWLFRSLWTCFWDRFISSSSSSSSINLFGCLIKFWWEVVLNILHKLFSISKFILLVYFIVQILFSISNRLFTFKILNNVIVCTLLDL